MPQYAQHIIERFWSYVDKNSSPYGCWLWKNKPTPRGYGQFHFTDDHGKKRSVRAHRFAYELQYGPIPEDMLICHKPPCVNRLCVLHLYTGNQKQNVQDAISLGRMASGVRNGTHTHPEKVAKGENVSRAKLSADVIGTIRDLRGIKTQEEIARMFHVVPSAISSIQRYKTWKHIHGNGIVIPLSNQGERSGQAKLSQMQVKEILSSYTGVRGQQASMARKYDVKPATISLIVRGINWKHLSSS